MSLKDVKPGKYLAKITDWGVEEVDKLDGAPLALIIFTFNTDSGAVETVKWNGFFTKTDGSINKKTVDTLKVCGLKGDFLDLLPGGPGLDTNQELEITLVKEGEYVRVEWVNEPGGSSFIKKVSGADISKKLKGLSLAAGLKSQLKNYAPGSEDVPF